MPCRRCSGPVRVTVPPGAHDSLTRWALHADLALRFTRLGLDGLAMVERARADLARATFLAGGL